MISLKLQYISTIDISTFIVIARALNNESSVEMYTALQRCRFWREGILVSGRPTRNKIVAR